MATAEPEIRVAFPDAPLRPGQRYTLDYTIEWAAGDTWHVLPLDVEPVSWASVDSVTAKLHSGPDIQQAVQRIHITPMEPGEFEWPAIRASMFSSQHVPGFGASAYLADVPDVHVLTAPGTTVLVATSPWPRIRAAGAVLLVLGLAVAGYVAYGRFRAQRSSEASRPIREREALLADIAALRKQHDIYAFYKALSSFAERLEPIPDADPLRDRFAARAEAVGYQGAVPTAAEMESDEREARRVFDRWYEEHGT